MEEGIMYLMDQGAGVCDVLALMWIITSLFKILTNFTSSEYEELVALVVTINHGLCEIHWWNKHYKWVNMEIQLKTIFYLHFLYEAWQNDYVWCHVQLKYDCIVWWCGFHRILHEWSH
jgi:hypothetical protein